MDQNAEQFATLFVAATAVVAYWDSLDAVSEDDERPTNEFKSEMDRRIDTLRECLNND